MPVAVSFAELGIVVEAAFAIVLATHQRTAGQSSGDMTVEHRTEAVSDKRSI